MDLKEAKAKTAKFYEGYAATYKGGHGDIPRELEPFTRLLLPGSRVLDLGCGPGRDLAAFLKLKFRSVGVDIAHAMCSLAAPSQNVLVADLEALPFRQKSFDALWARNSLLHIPKAYIPAVLRAAAKLLAPHGMVFISLKEGSGEEMKTTKNGSTFYGYWEEKEFAKVLRDTGFIVYRTEKSANKDPFGERHYLAFTAARKD